MKSAVIAVKANWRLTLQLLHEYSPTGRFLSLLVLGGHMYLVHSVLSALRVSFWAGERSFDHCRRPCLTLCVCEGGSMQHVCESVCIFIYSERECVYAV